jgi:hypothetical protein
MQSRSSFEEVNVVVFMFGVVIALGGAARSTWSPCGLSMLSQITPVAEAGRGHKFARTACWFIAGAALGGLALGCVMAGGAIVAAAAGLGHHTGIALIGGGAFAAAALDAHLFGFGPPFVRRQVNVAWLSKYRSWVYGVGFGWQIGAGLTTYVMTAAIPLMIAIGVVGANPWGALAIGVIFGVARGLAVLMGARLRTLAALHAFHRRFDAWTAPVRQSVIAVQLAVAVVAAWIIGSVLVAIVVTIAAVALLALTRSRGPGRDRTFDRGIMRGPRDARESRTEAVFTLLSKDFRG